MGINDWIDGAQLLLAPGPLLAIPLGCVIGMFFGAIPGLSGGTALAVVVAITPFMDPTTAVVLMVSIFASDVFGGSVTAILIGIPGTGGSTATKIDGFALTKLGRAGEAIAVGRSAGFIGGIAGSLTLLLLAPLVAKVAVMFGPAEYLGLALFGVTVMSAVSEQSLLKGLTAGWLGFLLATIGQDATTGVARFTFGSTDMLGGLDLVWVIVGLFAITQALQMVAGRDGVPPYQGKINVEWSKAWPVLWVYRRTTAIATAVGIVIGMVPGAGSTVSAWIGYTVAKANSKHPELFGKGAIDGVIGPESANDSCEGGSLVPTMTLGIPGSAGAAIILGGMTLAGMRPGPDLFSEQAPQAVATMLSFTLAHIVFLGVAVWSMRYVMKVLRVPTLAWPPVIIAFAAFGAYIIQGRVFGIYAALAVGLAGYFLIQRGYPLAPLLLGFVLGPILENNYVRVMLVSRGDILDYTLGRPIALVFFALAILAIGLDVYQRRMVRQRLAFAE